MANATKHGSVEIQVVTVCVHVYGIIIKYTIFLWFSPHYSVILTAQKKTNRHDSELLAGVRVHRHPPENVAQ